MIFQMSLTTVFSHGTPELDGAVAGVVGACVGVATGVGNAPSAPVTVSKAGADEASTVLSAATRILNS